MMLKKMYVMPKKYQKIKIIEDKVLDITNVATKAALNAKINEVKG